MDKETQKTDQTGSADKSAEKVDTGRALTEMAIGRDSKPDADAGKKSAADGGEKKTDGSGEGEGSGPTPPSAGAAKPSPGALTREEVDALLKQRDAEHNKRFEDFKAGVSAGKPAADEDKGPTPAQIEKAAWKKVLANPNDEAAYEAWQQARDVAIEAKTRGHVAPIEKQARQQALLGALSRAQVAIDKEYGAGEAAKMENEIADILEGMGVKAETPEQLEKMVRTAADTVYGKRARKAEVERARKEDEARKAKEKAGAGADQKKRETPADKSGTGQDGGSKDASRGRALVELARAGVG